MNTFGSDYISGFREVRTIFWNGICCNLQYL